MHREHLVNPIFIQKKMSLSLYVTAETEINLNWTTDLNVEEKTRKLPDPFPLIYAQTSGSFL